MAAESKQKYSYICLQNYFRFSGSHLGLFPLAVSSHSDVHSTVGILDHQNIGIAVEIWLQSRLQAEI